MMQSNQAKAMGAVKGYEVVLRDRIESMGVGGAVLISSSIRNQIKNKPEFELTSLGRVACKNVEKPMEVFEVTIEGLAVPLPEEMKGKETKVPTDKPGIKSLIRLAIIGFLARAIGAVLFWALGSQRSGNSALLDKEVLEERVAIIPFSNPTTDSNLNVCGDFCSDLPNF